MLLNLIEVSFKRNRKIYCSNKDKLDVNIGDFVVIEVEKGFDLGCVTKMEFDDPDFEMKSEPPRIVRKASENDLQRLDENRKKEDLAFNVCREKIQRTVIMFFCSGEIFFFVPFSSFSVNSINS